MQAGIAGMSRGEDTRAVPTTSGEGAPAPHLTGLPVGSGGPPRVTSDRRSALPESPHAGRRPPRPRQPAAGSAGAPVDDSGPVIADAVRDAEAELLKRFGRPATAAETESSREADRRLVELLAADGFSGPVFDRGYPKMIDRLAGYAWPILLGWITRGEIVRLCRDAGRPIRNTPLRQLTTDDRMELASEAVLAGERLFLEVGLRHGHWRPDGGLSLRTYFVNACVREFARVHDRWQKGRNDAEQLLLLGWHYLGEEPLLDTALGPEQLAVLQDQVSEAIGHIPDPLLRQVLAYRALGYTEREAAGRAGLRPKQAERRLARYREHARAAAAHAAYGKEIG
jgi:DNA-directed RNA polymerase specialized sigma24 family protein